MRASLTTRSICLLSILFQTAACSTATKSSVLGGVIGASIGAVIGHNQDNSNQSRAMGALVGAGLGALIGHSAHRSSNVQKQQEATLEQGFSEFPALTRPKLRSIWVPDRIEGNKYIKGHFIYVIEDGASWSR